MSRIGSRIRALDASNQSHSAPPRRGARRPSRASRTSLESSPRWSRVASYLLATAAESELMPSCGFVLALDVPAMAEVAFVALILDRGERRRYRTRLDRVNGTGDDDGDERTMKRRKLASSLLASTSRAIDACRYARLAVRTAATNSSRPVGGERRRERGARRWKRPSTRPREGGRTEDERDEVMVIKMDKLQTPK